MSVRMHIAILIDTDESAADRCKIFINGVREPAANLTGTTPSSGATNHLFREGDNYLGTEAAV